MSLLFYSTAWTNATQQIKSEISQLAHLYSRYREALHGLRLALVDEPVRLGEVTSGGLDNASPNSRRPPQLLTPTNRRTP